MPSSTANPIIGMVTISAILTAPRCPLKKPVPKTLAVGMLEPRPVEFPGDEGEELVKDGRLERDEPELYGTGGPELVTVVPVDSECEEELLGVNREGLVDLGEGDVELAIETAGDVAGVGVEGAMFIRLVVVEPRGPRISKSVAAHATGTPSLQTVRVGLGFTVEKL